MLTDTKLRTLKAKAKLYRVADTNGLCIEVRTNGARIWRYRYRYAGKASMVGLGEYPAVPLTEARAERDRLRLLVKGGGNPAHLARAERAAKLGQRMGLRHTCRTVHSPPMVEHGSPPTATAPSVH